MSRSAPVTVVIPTWNGWEMLQTCLAALERQTRPADEVIVVDNGSSDGTPKLVADLFPEIRLIVNPTNAGFSGACNLGFRSATQEHDVVLLNNDAVADERWLEALVEARDSAASDVGGVTGKMLSADGRIDNVGDFVTRSGVPFARGTGEEDDGRYEEEAEVFSVCGGASLYRRAMIEDVGGLDEDFFAYYEDADLGYRARLRGWKMMYTPHARVVHMGGGTSLRIDGFRLYHSTRNLWLIVVKCTPRDLLPSVLLRSTVVQCFWLARAVKRGDGKYSLRAHRDALRALPVTLRKRQEIQRRRAVDGRDLITLMPQNRFMPG